MADSMDKIKFVAELGKSYGTMQEKVADICAELALCTEKLVAAKTLYTSDRAAITNSTLLTEDEKTEWKANYASNLAGQSKDDLQAAIDAFVAEMPGS